MTKYDTVKRVAEVGERVLVTMPELTFGDYEKGDVLTVAQSLEVMIIATEKEAVLRHDEYEVIVGEKGKFNIERLEGEGVVARVVDDGKLFSTYGDFARAAGYPDAVDAVGRWGKVKALNTRKSELFEVLAKGAHEYEDYGDVYVIESADGERFLMGADGLKLTYPDKELTVEQAMDGIEGILRKVRREGYAGGYRDGKRRSRTNLLETQAKLDATIDKGVYRYGKTLEKLDDETAQEKRDRIVERARMDVEGLKRDSWLTGETYYRVSTEGLDYMCDAEFIVNKEKRTVVVLLKGLNSGKIRAKGIAKCAPNDCFNVHIGRAIALRRALGHNVPHEYLNAPQPTEVREGDVVKFASVPIKYTVLYTEGIKDNMYYSHEYPSGKSVEGFASCSDFKRFAKIIDDSRDGEAK